MGKLPIVLHIPHASTVIPGEVDFLLSPAELALEVARMTDHFTDELFNFETLGCQRLVFPVSRLVCDPERFEDDSQEPMAAVGMGVLYTKTSSGENLRPPASIAERAALLDHYYRPHHNAFEKMVQSNIAAQGKCLIIDCHSFPSIPLPYEVNPERPDICIGADTFHTPQWLIESLVKDFSAAGFSVLVNQPFSGAIVPLNDYGKNNKVLSVMVEVNRGIYMNEHTVTTKPNFAAIKSVIGSALANAIDQFMALQ